MPNATRVFDEAVAQRTVNTIRALTIDATQASGGGHPGMPLGAAPMGYALFAHVMRHNPKSPTWHNRDRYVQSAGHGSMLIYALLHLSGYGLPMEELRRHRQWGSLTPGHPEHDHTPGVEMTTGPLGQGISSAVGMALAEAHLATRFNRPGYKVVDHHTYVIAGDGDLMEGISSEASSFAGHQQLGKLIVLYDDNGISIDGPTSITFTEDVAARYRAYGWQVLSVEDGDDPAAIIAAVDVARKEPHRPSLLLVRTTIGKGAPNLQGTPKVHGAALGAEEAAAAKANLGVTWPEFTVPDDVAAHMSASALRGAKQEAEWAEMYARYKAAHPELAAEYERVMSGALPKGVGDDLPAYAVGGSTATRNASHAALNALAARAPELVGGSADLAGSNLTGLAGQEAMQPPDHAGRTIQFGIREHAMAAIANGISLHGGLRPFVATFLIFSDYLRPALRLSALMNQGVIYCFTHDSIALGEDGPTHQPIGELMALRLIPNVTVIRPADANETSQAWLLALQNTKGPIVLALSRQALPHLAVPAGAVARGAYVIAEAGRPGSATEGSAEPTTQAPTNAELPHLILIASGSEVQLCLAARDVLEAEGVLTRVVSMPSMELFEQQPEEYRNAVLPPAMQARVTVEAGVTRGWHEYAGNAGERVGVNRFGASGPGPVVMREYGLSVENVVAKARKTLARSA